MFRISIFIFCIILTACGQADVHIQIVQPSEATEQYNLQATQTPNPQNLLVFQDDASGIYFFYPATWQVNNEQGRIAISHADNTLYIEYNWFTENNSVPEIVASDDQLEESDPIWLLGDKHPTYINQQIKFLYYTSPQDMVSVHNMSFAPFIVANIGFSIRLEYTDLTLSESIRATTDDIVESFGFSWLVTRPSFDVLSGWNTYYDAQTDLQFQYPDNWTVTQTSGAIMVQQGDVRLLLLVNNRPSGISAGDLRKGDPTHIWLRGKAIPRVYLVYDDKIKSLFYGQPGDQITFDDNHIVAVVDTSSVATYDTIDLSSEILHQADLILTTLHS